MPTLPVHCSGIHLAGSCGCSLTTCCNLAVVSPCPFGAAARAQAAQPRRRKFATNGLTHGLCRAALMIMAALVVGSSTAGSFSFGDAPAAVGSDDFEADQSRERSADRSRPSRDRATHVDSSPRDNPAPPRVPRPKSAPEAAPAGRAGATAAATGAGPSRKSAE